MNKLPVDRLAELAPRLPDEVMNDIRIRMGDWLVSGGSQNDPYMWQQVRFAENWIEFEGEK